MTSDLNVSNNLFHHHLLWEKTLCFVEFEAEFKSFKVTTAYRLYKDRISHL